MRSLLITPLLCALARAGEPVPSKFAGLQGKVRWSGELADPFDEQWEEARWENKLNSLPHERMQFYYGDAPSAEAHVDAAQRSVPKELLAASAAAPLRLPDPLRWDPVSATQCSPHTAESSFRLG